MSLEAAAEIALDQFRRGQVALEQGQPEAASGQDINLEAPLEIQSQEEDAFAQQREH